MLLRLLAAIFASSATLCAAAQSVALPGERAFPESLSATQDGTLFVSSLASGGIYRVMPHSTEAKLWIEPGTFGTHSTFGVLVEEKAGILWVCSNDLSAHGMTVGTTDGVSALFAFDLKTGAANSAYRSRASRRPVMTLPSCSDWSHPGGQDRMGE
jgi:sugar lactone lactonase YvrE